MGPCHANWPALITSELGGQNSMSRLSSVEVHGLVRTVIKEKRPFSAIRLGDGEGRIMGFPEHVSTVNLADIWRRWFGHDMFSDIQVRFLQNGIKDACQAADIIGLPTATPNLQNDFGRVEALLSLGSYEGSMTRQCNSGFHLDCSCLFSPAGDRSLSRIRLM